MPKILITGNGFDLNIGLPTSYSDFINILIHIEENGALDFENIYQKSSNFNTIQNNFEPFIIDEHILSKLITHLQHNLWFQFFKSEYQIETWIDFENKIEYVLEKIFSSLEFMEAKIFNGAGLRTSNIIQSTDIFNNNIELTQVLNSFSIIRFRPNPTYFDLNIEFLVNKYGKYIDIDVEKLTKFLYQQLFEFKLIFNYYFEIFITPLISNVKLKIDSSYFKDIDLHYTFNFTSTFESLYSSNITQYLHGKINSKDNQIVLGISEIPLNNTRYKREFIPFTKYFQKLNNETDYVFIRELEKTSFNNYIFFFWGHSLDRSDRDYIDEVFNFIGETQSQIKKIVIVYHNNSSKSKMLINLLDIRGSQNIQDLMRSKILIFVPIDSDELKKELESNIEPQVYM